MCILCVLHVHPVCASHVLCVCVPCIPIVFAIPDPVTCPYQEPFPPNPNTPTCALTCVAHHPPNPCACSQPCDAHRGDRWPRPQVFNGIYLPHTLLAWPFTCTPGPVTLHLRTWPCYQLPFTCMRLPGLVALHLHALLCAPSPVLPLFAPLSPACSEASGS